MASKLSSKERIKFALDNGTPDYVPLNIDMHPGYRSDPFAVSENQFDVIDILQEMGTDPTVDIWFPIQSPHPDVRITYRREKDPDGGGYTRCKRYETPAGPLTPIVRETADWNSPEHMLFSRTTCGKRSARTPDLEMLDDYNAPRSKEVLIKDEKDLDRMEYLFRPLSGEPLERWREEALFAKGEAGKRNLPLHGRRTYNGSAMIWLCRPEDFMCKMVDDPEFVKRFLRIIQDWQNWALGAVLDIGVDIISRFGLYEGPSYWGARYFKRYLAPLIEEETQLIHRGGVLHAQGSSEDLTAYKDILKEMSLDVLMGVDEVQGRDDFQVLKRELGDRKAFWGGINSDVTLAGGNAEDIDSAVFKAITTLGQGGGLVLWPVWSIYYNIPWKHIETLIRVWKKYRNEAS